MTDVNFYRGSEALCEIGIQGHSIDRTAVTTAVTPDITMAYLQSLRVVVDEQVTAKKFINSGNGRNKTKFIKGRHNASATMSFWIPKDLDQSTPMEVWLLKQAFDGTHKKTEGTPDVYVIPDSDSFGEYGDDYLNVMTIEAGYNKSGAITRHTLIGAIVNRATFRFEEDVEVMVTYDMLVQESQKTSSAWSAGSLAEASEAPFVWGDVSVAYGDAAGSSAQNNITMLEFSIANNVTPLPDLANTSSTRTVNGWILGDRDITGTIRFRLTTETDNGQDLWEDVLNSVANPAVTTEGVTLKDIFVTMYQDATYEIKFELNDVVLGSIPEDIVGSGNPTVEIPFTAKIAVLKHDVLGTSSSPGNY